MHRVTVLRRAHLGTIKGAKPGKRWVFRREELVQYRESLYPVGKSTEPACPSISAKVFGGFRSTIRDSELDALLKPTSKKKPKSSTTISRTSSGARRS